MLTIHTYPVRIDLEGYDGEAAGTGSVSVPRGRLVGVQVQYGTEQPGSTTVALLNKMDGVEKQFLALDHYAEVDFPFAPVGEPLKDENGDDTTTLVPVVVGEELLVEVDHGDAETDGVIVTFAVEF